MTAHQENTEQFNPNCLALTCVAKYRRTIRAPLERVWENVLDWEHLPHLHSSSFDYVELDTGGDWGWRTWSDAEHLGHVELSVANHNSYVARTYQGEQQLSEIWTTLEPAGDNTDIAVEFFFRDIEDSAVESLGEMILALYTRLWDEDEAMMRQRHQRLREQRSNDVEVKLGPTQSVKQRLTNGEQIIFQLQRREYQLRMTDDALLAHPTICPHLLGPLTDSDIGKGILTCPWHGYQFDLASGECITPEHANCSLGSNAVLHEEDGKLIARMH